MADFVMDSPISYTLQPKGWAYYESSIIIADFHLREVFTFFFFFFFFE